MSLLYMDNFQNYGTVEEIAEAGLPWANIYNSGVGGFTDDPDGVSPGRVLRISQSGVGTSSTRLACPVSGNAMGIASRWWLDSLPSNDGNGPRVRYKTVANGDLYELHVRPNGSLRLIRISGADTEIAVTGPLVIGASAWWHVEFFLDRSTGNYEVRVEGVVVLEGTDGAPAGSDIGIVEWGNQDAWNGAASGPAFYIKDVVLWDDNGTSNNDFIGPVTVYTLKVNGDVSSGWDRSTGATDYELLDETTPNDADYISADDSLPAASIMQLEDLPADVVAVRAVQTMVRAWKTDGGDAKLQATLTVAGDDDDGAEHAISTAETYYWDVSSLSPDTGSAWTPAEVNSAVISINRTV